MPKTHRLDAGAETVHWGYFDARLEAAPHGRQRRHRHHLDRLGRARGDAAAAAGGARRAGGRAGARAARSCRATCAPGRWRSGAPRPARCSRCASRRSISTTTGATTIRVPSRARCRTTSRAGISCTSRSIAKRMTGRLPWGLELPLRPFFGVMAVAPPARLGQRLDAAAAQERRQSRQQGAGGGHHALSADPRRRRAVLGRRRPRRAGRRRGVRDGHRDRARSAPSSSIVREDMRWSGRAPRRRRTS